MDDITRRQQATRYISALAQVLDNRGDPHGGALRQAVGILLDPDPDGCRGCGTTLTYAGVGRRRVWCTEACRKRTSRR